MINVFPTRGHAAKEANYSQDQAFSDLIIRLPSLLHSPRLEMTRLSSGSGCARLSLMLIYRLLCVFVVCVPPSEQQRGGWFVRWGQLQEANDLADISGAGRPALHVCVFG